MLHIALTYARELTSKFNWKVQFNVRNVLAKDGLIPISIELTGDRWASVQVKPIQERFVINTFSSWAATAPARTWLDTPRAGLPPASFFFEWRVRFP